MKSYVIHLIRHGVSEGNLKGQYIGITDSPLSKVGANQIHKLKKQGTYPKAQAYYSSPLSRCKESLSIIYPNEKFEVIEGFKESSFGDWEGKTTDELRKIYPDFEKWISGKEQVSIPNGENGADFTYRVCAAFEELVNNMMKNGITSASVVTHGGVIMTILSAYGLPKAKFYDWITDNGCGYSLRITPGLWMRSMVAEVFQTLPVGDEEGTQPGNTQSAYEQRAAADLIWGEIEE